jgi:hypothetical protein
MTETRKLTTILAADVAGFRVAKGLAGGGGTRQI